jgi:hypothetical protein
VKLQALIIEGTLLLPHSVGEGVKQGALTIPHGVQPCQAMRRMLWRVLESYRWCRYGWSPNFLDTSAAICRSAPASGESETVCKRG